MNKSQLQKVSIYLVLSIWILIPGTMKAQNGKRYMHHEVIDDVYMPRDAKAGTSPAYKYQSSIFFTTQVNVDENGNNIINDAANEPSIAVDPTNPDRIAIGWRQFDNISSSFRQAGYGYSLDGGQTWTFPGVINPGIFRSDPVLDFDSEGRFYYNSLTVDDYNNFWCDVFRTEAGGVEWDNGVFAQGGDKQWMRIDRTGGDSDGNIYAFWSSSYSICDGSFTRSTDGGDSYEDCINVAGDLFWGTMATNSEGVLYLAGVHTTSTWDDLNYVVKSENASIPGVPVIWEDPVEVDLDGKINGWTGVNPAGLLGQLWIDVDKSGGAGDGNVYVCAAVKRYSVNDDGDIMFARSTDGGQTWDPPVKINDDNSTSNIQWFGTMSVAPNGRIDVVWLDTRDQNPGQYWSSLYYSYSVDQGQTWSQNERLSEAFDPHVGWPVQQKMGDYYDMVSDEAGAYLAWAATFNGEQDVYFGRILPQFTKVDNNNSNISFSAFPNPFKEKITIKYNLREQRKVNIALYDLYGKKVALLENKIQQAGTHEITFNAEKDLPAGIYYCRITAGSFSKTFEISYIK